MAQCIFRVDRQTLSFILLCVWQINLIADNKLYDAHYRAPFSLAKNRNVFVTLFANLSLFRALKAFLCLFLCCLLFSPLNNFFSLSHDRNAKQKAIAFYSSKSCLLFSSSFLLANHPAVPSALPPSRFFSDVRGFWSFLLSQEKKTGSLGIKKRSLFLASRGEEKVAAAIFYSFSGTLSERASERRAPSPLLSSYLFALVAAAAAAVTAASAAAAAPAHSQGFSSFSSFHDRGWKNFFPRHLCDPWTLGRRKKTHAHS